MSEELEQSGPSYTPYDGGESTSIAPPLLMRTSLRLWHRNHDNQKLNYASFVVYIHVPKGIGA